MTQILSTLSKWVSDGCGKGLQGLREREGEGSLGNPRQIPKTTSEVRIGRGLPSGGGKLEKQL